MDEMYNKYIQEFKELNKRQERKEKIISTTIFVLLWMCAISTVIITIFAFIN